MELSQISKTRLSCKCIVVCNRNSPATIVHGSSSINWSTSWFANPNDMRVIKYALKLHGLAVGLLVNFDKSKLLPLTPYSWHQFLWLAQMKWLDNLAIHWDGSRKVEWVLQKVRQKLSYWKIATWPLHVRLRIVQSIFMAYMQYYLIMIDWPKHMI